MGNGNSGVEIIKTGVSFGSALAIAISWHQHESVLWALLHGVLSWIYVIWHVITR